jgi:hypothetical protein
MRLFSDPNLETPTTDAMGVISNPYGKDMPP